MKGSKYLSPYTDAPIRTLEEDQFGIRHYVSAICSFIRSSETPMTIAVQGEWGCGKSSFLSLIENELCDDTLPAEEYFAPIHVNAWEMFLEETYDDAVQGLTKNIISQMAEHFEKLQEIAPDAYAWITVPGTQIDYPIVQHPTDNTFYLNHNPKGEYEFAGAIFTEDYNATDFEDPNTVIYGHNMKNGSMFQELHKFEDKAFFEEHPEFTIYTPDEVLHYHIFAAYTYDNRHLLKEFDFDDSEVFRLYLEDILGMKSMSANIDKNAEIKEDDRIVTLSTCNGINEQRYLVQGVLLSK